MTSKRKIVPNRTWQLAQVWGVLSILFLNILGSYHIESFHSLFLEHEVTELHKLKNESDPCHITLYHQLDNGGCNHDSHFVKENKCPLCDIQFHSDPITEVRSIVLSPIFGIVSIPFSIKLSIVRVNFQFAGRAPPVS